MQAPSTISGIKSSKTRMLPVYAVAFMADICLGIFAVAIVLLAEQLGATAWQIGVVGAGYGLSYCFSPYFLGRLGDQKWGRRKSILIAISGFAAIQVFYLAFVTNWILAFVGNVCAGITIGMFWPSTSSHASEVAGSNHDRVVARFCVSWSIGYCVGPFLSGVFSEFSYIFAFIVVLCIAGGILGIVGFHPIFHEGRQAGYAKAGLASPIIKQVAPSSLPVIKKEQRVPILTPELGVLDESNRKRQVRFQRIAVVVGSFLFAFNNQAFLSLFPTYAISPDGLDLTPTLMGVLLLSFGIGRTVIFWATGYLRKSLREPVLIAALGVIALTLGLVGFVTSFVGLLLVMSIYGLMTGFLFSIGLYFSLDFSEEEKGKNTGILESVVGMGFFISPLIGGYLMDLTGVPTSPWILGSLVTVGLFTLLVVLYRRFILSTMNPM